MQQVHVWSARILLNRSFYRLDTLSARTLANRQKRKTRASNIEGKSRLGWHYSWDQFILYFTGVTATRIGMKAQHLRGNHGDGRKYASTTGKRVVRPAIVIKNSRPPVTTPSLSVLLISASSELVTRCGKVAYRVAKVAFTCSPSEEEK